MHHCVAMGQLSSLLNAKQIDAFKLKASADDISKHCLTIHYHTIQTFNNPENESFHKVLWEKEKILVTSCF